MRRKPRFTPDPPPYNATPEQMLAWVNTQLQRIEDYWPRDYEERVTALEELISAIRGDWTIRGQSLVRFEGTASEDTYPLTCGTSTGYLPNVFNPSESEYIVSSIYDFNYSASSGKFYLSSNGTFNLNFQYPGLLEITPSTVAITIRYAQGTRLGHFLFSQSGVGDADAICYCPFNPTISDRDWKFYQLSDWSLLGTLELLPSTNAWAVAEANDYILFFRDSVGTNYFTFAKGNYSTYTDVNAPPGYAGTAFAGNTSGDDVVVVVKNTTTGAVGFVMFDGTNFGSVTEIDSEYDVDAIVGQPVAVGDSYYWPYNKPADTSGRFCALKTSKAGVVEGAITLNPGSTTGKGGIPEEQNRYCISYNATTNALYYSLGGATVYQYSLSTGEIRSCTPDTPTGWDSLTAEPSALAFGEDLWLVDQDVYDGIYDDQLGVARVVVHTF